MQESPEPLGHPRPSNHITSPLSQEDFEHIGRCHIYYAVTMHHRIGTLHQKETVTLRITMPSSEASPSSNDSSTSIYGKQILKECLICLNFSIFRCLSVYMHNTCMQVATEARRGHSVPWNRSYRSCEWSNTI